MNKLRVLLLTASILLPAPSLRAQFEPPPKFERNAPVVCNDGTITVNVVRAFKDVSWFFNQWVIEGWWTVRPGKCDTIGPYENYADGGLIFESSVTLLAFAFGSADGGRAVRVRDSTGGLFKPSNQQLCVQDGVFRYTRDISQGDPAKECDRGLPGYYRIPVSLEYDGVWSYAAKHGNAERDFLHVSFGPSDRAIPSGKQTSSGGASQSSAGAGSSQSNDDASPSLCGPVSCRDLFLQGLNKAVRDAEAQRAAASANHNLPPPAPPAAAPPPVVSRAPATAPPVVDDHPIFLVVMCVAQNLEKYSYNNAPAGSKMAAFASITERYIRSVAKPGWEYWIEEAQFQNFDAQTTAPETLVSQISPKSGRFDTSRPDCPSNYKWYQLPIKR